MSIRFLTAVLHKEEDLCVAECPEVGTVSQGYTIEEAISNLREATELYLEEFPLGAGASGQRDFKSRSQSSLLVGVGNQHKKGIAGASISYVISPLPLRVGKRRDYV